MDSFSFVREPAPSGEVESMNVFRSIDKPGRLFIATSADGARLKRGEVLQLRDYLNQFLRSTASKRGSKR